MVVFFLEKYSQTWGRKKKRRPKSFKSWPLFQHLQSVCTEHSDWESNMRSENRVLGRGNEHRFAQHFKHRGDLEVQLNGNFINKILIILLNKFFFFILETECLSMFQVFAGLEVPNHKSSNCLCLGSVGIKGVNCNTWMRLDTFQVILSTSSRT